MNETTNLLKETIDVLTQHEREPGDILWIGNEKFWFTWGEFITVADVDYDAGFGGQEVASDLMIVGKDFHMTRGEYDGSEWWNFESHIIERPQNHHVPDLVVGHYWPTLKDLADPENIWNRDGRSDDPLLAPFSKSGRT